MPITVYPSTELQHVLERVSLSPRRTAVKIKDRYQRYLIWMYLYQNLPASNPGWHFIQCFWRCSQRSPMRVCGQLHHWVSGTGHYKDCLNQAGGPSCFKEADRNWSEVLLISLLPGFSSHGEKKKTCSLPFLSAVELNRSRNGFSKMRKFLQSREVQRQGQWCPHVGKSCKDNKLPWMTQLRIHSLSRWEVRWTPTLHVPRHLGSQMLHEALCTKDNDPFYHVRCKPTFTSVV